MTLSCTSVRHHVLFSDDVAVLFWRTLDSCHLYIVDHVGEGQTEIDAADGHSSAPFWWSGHWCHLRQERKGSHF